MTQKTAYNYFILAALIVAVFFADKYYLSKRAIVYPDFGITIPAGYTTHGIDVSRYQKNIDWKAVANMSDKGQKISFAIIKATEGTQLSDKQFDDNWEESKENNLIRGAYLYFHPNKSGKEQANYFLSKVELKPGDLPPVVDIEELKKTAKPELQKRLQECLDVLEEKYKAKPIIYSNVDFYENYLGESFNEYLFWAAHYEQKEEPRINRDWLIWQHNCKGKVNGIDAEVDFNVVNGTIYSLKKICL